MFITIPFFFNNKFQSLLTPNRSNFSSNFKKNYKTMSQTMEPILQENKNRFVIFPIQHHDIWEWYKKQEASIWLTTFTTENSRSST